MADLEGRVNGTVATSGFSAGLILSDDGSVQMFGSNSMTEGSVQELKVGMRVKCQVRKDRRRLFAYNIAVDHSFTPTYYGIVVPTHREQGLTVRDVLNDLHLNDELVGDIDYAIGSKLSFQLQDGGITNIEVLDRFPFANEVGAVFEQKSRRSCGFLFVPEYGRVFYHEASVIDVSEEYVGPKPDIGRAVRCDVIGKNKFRRANRIIVSEQESDLVTIARDITGVIYSYDENKRQGFIKGPETHRGYHYYGDDVPSSLRTSGDEHVVFDSISAGSYLRAFNIRGV